MTEYERVERRKTTNVMTPHLASLEHFYAYTHPAKPGGILSVQACFASGPNTHIGVLYELDRESYTETVVREPFSSIHTVMAARRRRNNGTILVTAQDTRSLTEMFYYSGCNVRPKKYKPKVQILVQLGTYRNFTPT